MTYREWYGGSTWPPAGLAVAVGLIAGGATAAVPVPALWAAMCGLLALLWVVVGAYGVLLLRWTLDTTIPNTPEAKADAVVRWLLKDLPSLEGDQPLLAVKCERCNEPLGTSAWQAGDWHQRPGYCDGGRVVRAPRRTSASAIWHAQSRQWLWTAERCAEHFFTDTDACVGCGARHA